jgi:hypothetical protein
VNAALGGIPTWQIADPVLGMRLRPRSGEADSRGYRNRGERPTDAIVALGDSMTFCHSVHVDEAWPQRVEALTSLPTYNMGVTGYGPAHYVALLSQALALAPKLLLVALYSGNDAADAYEMVYERGQLPELRSTDPAELAAIERAARSRPAVYATWRETRDQLGLRTPDPDSDIALVALGRAVGARLVRRHPPRGWSEMRGYAEASDPNVAMVVDSGAVRTILTPRVHLEALDPDDPRISAGIEATVRALRTLQARLPDATRLGVVLIPTKELVFFDLARAQANAPPDLERLAHVEGAFWDRIRNEASKQGAAVVDALPSLRNLLARGVNPYHEDNDSHPGATGYEAIAEAVAASPVVASLRAPPSP